MSTQKLEVAIWALIFGGLVVLGLGIAVQRSDTALGWGLVALGAVAAAVGVVLIIVRSRIPDRS
jgi:hypothetical protein